MIQFLQYYNNDNKQREVISLSDIQKMTIDKDDPSLTVFTLKDGSTTKAAHTLLDLSLFLRKVQTLESIGDDLNGGEGL